MKIKYQPLHGIPRAIHALSALYPATKHLSEWKLGELKEIPDDITIPFVSNRTRYRIRLVDDLLGSPDYVLQDGTNPNYTCTRCKVLSREDGVCHPFNHLHEELVPLEIDGKRVCTDCFNAAKPHWTPDGVEFQQDNPAKSASNGHQRKSP